MVAISKNVIAQSESTWRKHNLSIQHFSLSISLFCQLFHSIHLLILLIYPFCPFLPLSTYLICLFLPSVCSSLLLFSIYLFSTFLICKFLFSVSYLLRAYLSSVDLSPFYPSFSSVHCSFLSIYPFWLHFFSVHFSLLSSIPSVHLCSFLYSVLLFHLFIPLFHPTLPLVCIYFPTFASLCLCLHSTHLFPLSFSPHSSSLPSVDFSYSYRNLTDLWFEILDLSAWAYFLV